MTVNDLLRKIWDSYVEIAINERKGNEHTGRSWMIKPHAIITTKIPEEIQNAQVAAIIPYFDRIAIEVETST